MKAVMMAAQAVKAGDVEAIVAGGMENMSQVPHYIDGRNGVKLGISITGRPSERWPYRCIQQTTYGQLCRIVC